MDDRTKAIIKTAMFINVSLETHPFHTSKYITLASKQYGLTEEECYAIRDEIINGNENKGELKGNVYSQSKMNRHS